MSRTATTADVYLSYPQADEAVARVVLDQFIANELRAVGNGFGSRMDGGLPVRHALEASATFVALVTPAALASDALAFEYGMAWGRWMPAYVLTAGTPYPQLLAPPIYLKRLPRFTFPDTMPQLVAAIRADTAPVTEAERQALAQAYVQTGVPADSLAADPEALSRLADLFAARGSTRRLPPPVLLRELTWLRKAKRLPKLTRPTPA